MIKKNGNVVEVFIEISKHSSVKYEYDEVRQCLMVDRFLHTSMYYPFNYGFIADTQSEDSDPIDALVLTQEAVLPGTIIKTRIIGMLETEDENGRDFKLITVPINSIDPDVIEIKDIFDVREATRHKIMHFFEYYKSLEKNKWVKVKNWQGREKAMIYFEKAKEKFLKNASNK